MSRIYRAREGHRIEVGNNGRGLPWWWFLRDPSGAVVLGGSTYQTPKEAREAARVALARRLSIQRAA